MRKTPFEVGKDAGGATQGFRARPSRLLLDETVIVRGIKITNASVKSVVGRPVVMRLTRAEAAGLRDELTRYLNATQETT